MNPDEILALIEANHQLVQGIDGIRTGLIAAGWSESGAEQAAIVIFNTLIAM